MTLQIVASIIIHLHVGGASDALWPAVVAPDNASDPSTGWRSV